MVGAASKGIIQRNYQHNATVYKTPYAKNPFDAVTDEEIEYYKNAVERSTNGKFWIHFLLLLFVTNNNIQIITLGIIIYILFTSYKQSLSWK